MTLKLYYHPFSSYCQKVLVALYERDVPFEGLIVELGDPEQKAALEALWPMAKFPVLRDEARGLTLPEASIIVEHVDRIAPGGPRLVPGDAEAALQVRLWDRIFDLYVNMAMQKIVTDNLRPPGAGDSHGVGEARRTLATAFHLVDAELGRHGGEWATGDSFTMADCAAAPALFYANLLAPVAEHPRLAAYLVRLRARPSFARTVEEARPFRPFFPLPWRDECD